MRRSPARSWAAGVPGMRRDARRRSPWRSSGPGSGRSCMTGKRDVNIPPHLTPLVHEHMILHVQRGPGALLFPAAGGGHMAPSALYAVYHPAREAAGRPDLRFHDLRHTGATLAAATGATLADLMHRLGHSTPSAAMRYQHASEERDRDIASALS